MVQRSLVSVVDDDESVRESLPDLLKEFGFAVQAFSSAEAFLASNVIDETECLILDIAMPGMTGPDLQRELTQRHKEIPIVFVTAFGGENVRSRTGVPRTTARYGSKLPGAGRKPSRPQRPRSAEAHCKSKRYAHHLYYRLRRCADDGEGNEGWRRRVPYKAVRRRSASR